MRETSKSKILIRFISLTFVVGTFLDVSIFVTTNWKDIPDSLNSVGFYIFKLTVAWLIFSIVSGFFAFVLWYLIRLGKNQNATWNTWLFVLMFPFIFAFLILTAIGLQLRFLPRAFFPANFDPNFFTFFGFSMLFFIFGIIGFLVRIFIKSRHQTNGTELLEINNAATDTPSQYSKKQIALTGLVGLVIAKTLSDKWGFSVGLTGLLGVFIVAEVGKRILEHFRHKH